MAEKRAWAAYPESYRAREVKILADWIGAGESGLVVGLAGSGKSNLLGFVCRRPEVLRPYLTNKELKLALVQVDLNNLPDSDLVTLFQIILRALYEARAQFATIEPELAEVVENLYRKVEDKDRPFLSQSALREVLLSLAAEGMRLVLVLDPFDEFCRTAPLEVLDNLRGLRDGFKTTLSYIMGVGQPLAYLRDPLEIGKIYQLLDIHVCRTGAMDEADARWIIDQVASATDRSFTEAEIERLIELTGSYPSLLKAASLWLAQISPVPEPETWAQALTAERSVQYRLEAIWNGLTIKEQELMSELEKWQSKVAARIDRRQDEDGAAADRRQALETVLKGLTEPHRDLLIELAAKGLCCQTGTDWRIASDLMAHFVARIKGGSGGKIWVDQESETLYQGQTPLENLAPLERSILSFLVQHPRVRHTKTDLIVNTWPEELRREGVTDQSLYQAILELRKKIEPDWTKPRHLITWRGKPEGGYQFFSEGQRS